jgi:hypothetical protein
VEPLVGRTNDADSEENAMETASRFFVALVLGLFAVVFVSQAIARAETHAAAVQRCRAQAQAQYPLATDALRTGPDTGRNRRAAYRACMLNSGFRR